MFRKSKKEPRHLLIEKEINLLQRIQDLEEQIQQQPLRALEEEENQKRLVPAPDDWDEQQREKALMEKLSQRQLKNEQTKQRYYQFSTIIYSGFTLLLLVWIISLILKA